MNPAESAEYIARNSKYVTINGTKVSELAKMMYNIYVDDKYNMKSWKKHPVHPQTMDASTVDWIFFVDTLNFSFWSENQASKFEVKWKGKPYTGYFSLCAAVNRALEAGINITEAKFYSKIGLQELNNLMLGENGRQMSLIEERLEVIQEAGSVLLNKYDGSFVNCIQKCDKSAEKLLKLIVENFKSYKDEAAYNCNSVSFYKRAQILIADIWLCFEGQGLGEFHDIDTLTMFADYRIPQVLAYFGALEYSHDLKKLLEQEHLFQNGDEMEVELRGCSIWCVELIKKEIKKMVSEQNKEISAPVNSILIDNFLWDYRREHDDKVRAIPFHKVRCIYY